MTPRFWSLRDALLGIAITLLSLLGVEGGLWLMHVESARPPELSRGFDPSQQYLRPDPEHPGNWRTHLGVAAIDQLSLPPKGSARRVLLMGGSNTRGFREQILERALEAGSDGEWEVLNLGRPGYGSGRVSILLDQALSALDPDIVVIYSGHNEFVERSFRADYEKWGGAGMRWIARMAEKLRIARVLRDVARGQRPRRHDDPLAWIAEYGKFSSLPYSETQAEFERYGENLRHMIRASLGSGARVVLATVVWNRFSEPRVSTLGELDSAARVTVESDLRAARALYPAYFTPLLPAEAFDRVRMEDWGRTHGDAPRDLPGLRPLTGPLAGVEPRFFEGHWDPKIRVFYDALDKLHAGVAPERRPDLEQAAAKLDEVLALVPHHAQALFERALVAWALGERGERVRGWFEDAARYDHAPRKGTPLSNEHVLELAAEFPEVLLVDLDRHFQSTTEDGLVGWELMVDHCHLGPLAGEHALETFAARMLAAWPEEETR